MFAFLRPWILAAAGCGLIPPAFAQPDVHIEPLSINLSPASPSAALSVSNTGTEPLTIDYVSVDGAVGETWLTWTPDPAASGPVAVAPGTSVPFAVTADFAAAPAPPAARTLLFYSSDPDESPYPGGVEIALAAAAGPANDACADAAEIVPGTRNAATGGASADGGESCSADSSADVWFRYSAAVAGETTIALCGSDFDTVLSIHSGCPGVAANEIACNDDATEGPCAGTRSSFLRFQAAAGTSYWIRLAGYQGATGSATIELTAPAAAANSAETVRVSAPSGIMTGQEARAEIVMRNTGAGAWTNASSHQLAVLEDPCGLLGGATRFGLPPEASVPPGGSWAFTPPLRSPVGGGPVCRIRLQMVQEFVEFFGESAEFTVTAGGVFSMDFASGPAGWTGAALAGDASVAAGPAGLCASVPEAGDNIAGWASPERLIPLTDGAIHRVRAAFTSSGQPPDAIPLINLIHQNFTSSGGGGNYGGEAWILDVEGGANAPGRAGGRTSFDFFIAPNSLRLPQWRGEIDPAQSAFTPAADAVNDFGLVFRVLDLASGAVNAGFDSGTVCLGSLRVDALPESALASLGTVYAPPLNNATHLAQSPAQAGAGTAVIDDAAATARYALTLSGAGARKSLFPFDPSLDNGVNLNLQLYPVPWETGALYRGTVRIRSDSGGGAGPEGGDPADAVFLIFDTTTVELGQTHFTTRGAPGNMHLAASPRLAATAGRPQDYVGYFSGQNATASAAAGAARLRLYAEFFNTEDIGPDGAGADPFAVEALTVERIAPPGEPATPTPEPSPTPTPTPTPGPPVNDVCASALEICPGTAGGDTSAATPDGDASCGQTSQSPDVWFRYSPPVGGQAKVSLCGSAFDTVVSVHTGCPGAGGSETVCNDDSEGPVCPGRQSEAAFTVQGGQSYWIRVAGYQGASGAFTLLLEGPSCDAEPTPTATPTPTPSGTEIFVEIDWMEDGTHSHRPAQDVLDAITSTFAAEGIAIHLDVSNALTHQSIIRINGGVESSNDVQTILQPNFNHEGDPRYYYSIWGHDYAFGDGPATGSSGLADIGGRVHLVTLGSFPGNTGTFAHQTGTFVHEFGHNLGQLHGGADGGNFKPNYLSIMNYHYQLDGIGRAAFQLGFSPTAGGFNEFGYSHGLLPALNEANLNEAAGIGLGIAVDWNCNGNSAETGVSKDLQGYDHCLAANTLDFYSDYDNWTDIRGYIRTSAGPPAKAKAAAGRRPEPCITFAEHEKARNRGRR